MSKKLISINTSTIADSPDKQKSEDDPLNEKGEAIELSEI